MVPSAPYSLLQFLGFGPVVLEFDSARLVVIAGIKPTFLAGKSKRIGGRYTMAETRPQQTPSAPGDITQRVMGDHERILALFEQYLASQPDSRQALVKQILRELASHLEMEEDLVFQEVRKLGSESLKLLGATEVEHEEIKAMILE